MNNSRKNIYEKNIIQYLLKTSKTSAKQISIQVGLSEKNCKIIFKRNKFLASYEELWLYFI